MFDVGASTRANLVRATTLDANMAETGIAHLALLRSTLRGWTSGAAGRAPHHSRATIARRQLEFAPSNIVTDATMFEGVLGYRFQPLSLNRAPLFPCQVERCEIYATQSLAALPA